MLAGRGCLILRADAGATIGAGHVMRCLAIAQACKRLGFKACLVARELPGSLQKRFAKEGVSTAIIGPVSDQQDAEQTLDAAAERGADWVLVDSYTLGSEYRRRLASSGRRVMTLNDFEPTEATDGLVNANPQAAADRYPQFGEDAMLLLGPRYCLLREEFGIGVAPRRWQHRPRRLLIAAGGSDPAGLSLTALSALAALGRRKLEVTVIVGGANPSRDQIESAARALPCRSRVLFNRTDMPSELRRADIAITAAGGSCWEMAHSGLPMLAIATADNQIPVARAIAASGCGVDLGRHEPIGPLVIAEAVASLLDADLDLLRAMSSAGERLVDGRGAERVAALMTVPFVRFRSARMDDARLLWRWRNDRTVRRVSLTTGPVPYDDHCDWLRKRLRRTDCRLLMAVDQAGDPFGQARFDNLGAGATAEISVSIEGKSRGRGLGAAVVRHATEHILGRRLAAAVGAVIKPENHASQRAFVKAGYTRASDSPDPDKPLRFSTAAFPNANVAPSMRAA